MDKGAEEGLFQFLEQSNLMESTGEPSIYQLNPESTQVFKQGSLPFVWWSNTKKRDESSMTLTWQDWETGQKVEVEVVG